MNRALTYFGFDSLEFIANIQLVVTSNWKNIIVYISPMLSGELTEMLVNPSTKITRPVR